MQVQAYQKSIRTSPRKMRLVADSIRGMNPTKALLYLKFMHKRAAEVLYKVLRQAIKNAVENSHLEEENLVMTTVMVEEGQRYKRMMAASRGRARMILKRTCNIKIVLEDKVDKKESK